MMNIAELLNEFRDMSYETGWISGKIEAGSNHSESDQNNCIAKRNELEADLTNRVAALVEALESAWPIVNHSALEVTKEKVRKALALAEGDK